MPSIARQVVEQIVLGRRELHGLAVSQDFAPLKIECEIADVERSRLAGWRLTEVPAADGTSAGQQLHIAERLRYVIIGTRLKAAHLVHFLIFDSDHDDRYVADLPD